MHIVLFSVVVCCTIDMHSALQSSRPQKSQTSAKRNGPKRASFARAKLTFAVRRRALFISIVRHAHRRHRATEFSRFARIRNVTI